MADQASAHPAAAKIRTATDVKHSSERVHTKKIPAFPTHLLAGSPEILRDGRAVCGGQFSRYGVAESGWTLGQDLRVRPG